MIRGVVVTANRNKNIVNLWVRTEDKRKVKVVVTGFRPYFYVKSSLGEYQSLFGDKVAKIVLDDPSKVPELRTRFEKTFEADIPYTRRFFIDKDIYSCVEVLGEGNGEVTVDHNRVKPLPSCNATPVLWLLDIEVLADRMPEASNPVYPIIAISIYDYERDMYVTWAWSEKFKTTVLQVKYDGTPWEVRTFDNEELMLMDFVSELFKLKPDVIAGWNIAFDRNYLLARLRRLRLLNNIEFVDWFDFLEADRTINRSRRGYALKHVTVEEGFETKKEAKEASDVLPLWNDKPIEVIKYNVRDVWRIKKLNERYKYFELYWAYKEITGLVHIEDTFSSMKIVDITVLRTAREQNTVLPTSGEGERFVGRLRGAIVLSPTPGLYENVAVFDMSKYYPSLIVSFNISPEMKLRRVDRANNIWLFRQDKPGIIPLSVVRVLSVEEKLRREQQNYKPEDPMWSVLDMKILAVKGVRNSFYGVMGNPHFRLFDPDCASTITGLGREGILFVVEKAKEKGYKAVYGDTDSLFVQVPFDKAERLAQELAGELRRYFRQKYGLKSEPTIELKFEKYYRRILFTEAKKRYAGWCVWKKGKETDKIDIVGFEAVRSDAAPFTAYAEHKLFELVLREGKPQGAMKLMKELEQEARERPLDDIALYANITKPLNEYKNLTPHVKAVIYSNMHLGTNFGPGSKVKYIFVKSVKGLPPTDVVAFETEEQIKDKVVVDWAKQLDRILHSPLRRILKVIGWSPSLRDWW